MAVFTIQGAPGQRFVDVLEPVSADKIRVVGDRAKIAGVGGAALALAARTDQPLPEEAAIG